MLQMKLVCVTHPIYLDSVLCVITTLPGGSYQCFGYLFHTLFSTFLAHHNFEQTFFFRPCLSITIYVRLLSWMLIDRCFRSYFFRIFFFSWCFIYFLFFPGNLNLRYLEWRIIAFFQWDFDLQTLFTATNQ